MLILQKKKKKEAGADGEWTHDMAEGLEALGAPAKPDGPLDVDEAWEREFAAMNEPDKDDDEKADNKKAKKDKKDKKEKKAAKKEKKELKKEQKKTKAITETIESNNVVEEKTSEEQRPQNVEVQRGRSRSRDGGDRQAGRNHDRRRSPRRSRSRDRRSPRRSRSRDRRNRSRDRRSRSRDRRSRSRDRRRSDGRDRRTYDDQNRVNPIIEDVDAGNQVHEVHNVQLNILDDALKNL